MPAHPVVARDVVQPLKDGGRGATSWPRGAAFRRALIAAEVALALMLLTGGGLLLQTFVHLQPTDLGFDPRQCARRVRQPAARRRLRHRGEAPRLLRPGARTRAGAARRAPGGAGLGAAARRRQRHELRDRRTAGAGLAQSQTPVTWYRLVSAGYFETMGMRIVARPRVSPTRPAAPSVVVNETFATNVLSRRGSARHGACASAATTVPWFTIVGIAADVKMQGRARVDTESKPSFPTGSSPSRA